MSSPRDDTSAENTQTQSEVNPAEPSPALKKRSLEEDDEAASATKKQRVDESEKDGEKKVDTKETTVLESETLADKTTDHASLVANHYNSLEETGLKQRDQSRIVYMRNFNNWMKSVLINEFIQKLKDVSRGSRLTVMDMCCGKGGDLLKWQKANIRHLICADIADLSVEQCQGRYNDLCKKNQRRGDVFSAEFIVADCTKIQLRKKFKDPSLNLDLVSCQFALHYSFESYPQAEMMLRNASETLKPGGYFIGTIPDAYDLVTRWRKSESNKFGNDVYTVEFECEDKEKPPLFGAKYNFRLEGVVNCPEFLVYRPLLKKLGLKMGLKLVMFERFEDYCEKMMKGESRSLLGRMQGLEAYPASQGTELVSKNPDDYKHAEQYMENEKGQRKIGTLSRSEWEATSLYAVFAFQKMKTRWDKDGKPQYEDL